MVNGYVGEILKINLSNSKIEKIFPEEKILRNYIGGSGLGIRFLYDLTGKDTDPLGEENVLIFMTGPLTGTRAFSSDRFQVTIKSPLTGIFGEANCGGTWGSALKRSGYDGIIITGKSKKPVFIWIDNKNVKILDASSLWGLDTFETDLKLKDLAGTKSEALCIGPAGENLVKFASISTVGEHSRVAGRSGVGAVMGSKKLKAIVVQGDQKFEIINKSGLDDFHKKYAKSLAKNNVAEYLRELGTFGGVESSETIGNLPVKNWSEIRFKDANLVTGQVLIDKGYLKKRYYCGSCNIGCGRCIQIEEGKYKTDGIIGGPEYESAALLGPNLLLKDIEALMKANELCNRYGMDTITTGSVIGMAMECYEKGLINKKFLDGKELKWGDPEAILDMIHKIGKREGAGNILAEGTREMANIIGSYSIEFAPQVKGLEFAAHDPRAKIGSALGNATSNRGACHMAANTSGFEGAGGSVIEGMGYDAAPDRFTIDGKAEFVMKWENFMGMFDTIPSCKFIASCGIGLSQITETLELITGFGIDNREFLRIGERIFNLKRLYNVNCGITRKDDTLPARFLMHIKEEGDKGHTYAPLGKLLSEYYKLRGWDEIGIPTPEKLKELDVIY